MIFFFFNFLFKPAFGSMCYSLVCVIYYYTSGCSPYNSRVYLNWRFIAINFLAPVRGLCSVYVRHDNLRTIVFFFPSFSFYFYIFFFWFYPSRADWHIIIVVYVPRTRFSSSPFVLARPCRPRYCTCIIIYSHRIPYYNTRAPAHTSNIVWWCCTVYILFTA